MGEGLDGLIVHEHIVMDIVAQNYLDRCYGEQCADDGGTKGPVPWDKLNIAPPQVGRDTAVRWL